MGKYLDSRGLITLWNKIKSYFVDIYDRIESVETDLEGVVYSENGDASAEYSSTNSIENRLLPKCIIPEEDGLYQDRNGIIYPVSHPPLSTLPSILPQSFGTYDVYEILVPTNIGTILSSKFFATNTIYYINSVSYNSYNYLLPNKFVYNANLNLFQLVYDTGSNYYSMLDLMEYFLIIGNILLLPINDNDEFYICECPNTFTNADYIKTWFENNYHKGVTTNVLGNKTGDIYSYGNYFYQGKVRLVYNNPDFYIELLLNSFYTNEIPSNATIMEASSFNSNNCIPAICRKIDNKWNIRNNENIIPDFTLVRYFIDRNDYYYCLELEKKEINHIDNELPIFNEEFAVYLTSRVTDQEIIEHLKCLVIVIGEEDVNQTYRVVLNYLKINDSSYWYWDYDSSYSRIIFSPYNGNTFLGIKSITWE